MEMFWFGCGCVQRCKATVQKASISKELEIHPRVIFDQNLAVGGENSNSSILDTIENTSKNLPKPLRRELYPTKGFGGRDSHGVKNNGVDSVVETMTWNRDSISLWRVRFFENGHLEGA